MALQKSPLHKRHKYCQKCMSINHACAKHIIGTWTIVVKVLPRGSVWLAQSSPYLRPLMMTRLQLFSSNN